MTAVAPSAVKLDTADGTGKAAPAKMARDKEKDNTLLSSLPEKVEKEKEVTEPPFKVAPTCTSNNKIGCRRCLLFRSPPYRYPLFRGLPHLHKSEGARGLTRQSPWVPKPQQDSPPCPRTLASRPTLLPDGKVQ